MNNAIFNETVTKLFNILKKCFLPNLNSTSYIKKISAYRFEDFPCTFKLQGSCFQTNFFQGVGSLFMTAKPLLWPSCFYTKN